MNIEPAKSYAICGAIATARSVALNCCTHPLEVIKLKLQDAPGNPKTHLIAKEIFHSQGVKGFYQGLLPQMNRILLKEWWRWPVIVYLPQNLEKKYSLSPVKSQLITGLFVATLDALTTAPLEKYRVQIITGTRKSNRILQGGWSGFVPLWLKGSIGWTAFSVSQRTIRDQYKQSTQKSELDVVDLAIIGTCVGLSVSLCMAPFDLANTRSQSRGTKMYDLLKNSLQLKLLWRGFPLQTLIFSIHNIASVAIIEKLSKKII